MDVLDKYEKEFKKFNADTIQDYRSQAAPHQPILLLSLIKLYDEGKINLSNIDPKTVLNSDSDLRKMTDEFWRKAESGEDRFNIKRPFYHLEKKDFWRWILKDDLNSALDPEKDYPTLGGLKERIEKVYFPQNLIELLNQQDSRKILIEALIMSGNLKEDEKMNCFTPDTRKWIRKKMGI